MEKGRKWFVLIEALLGAMVLVVALLMLMEKRDGGLNKISVIIPNAEDNQWAAFRYGLKMAEEDLGTEVFIVSTGTSLTVDEERELIETELKNGADAVIVEPVPGVLAGEMLEEMNSRIPVVLVESLEEEQTLPARLPVVQPDDYEMGRQLAQEILRDYGDELRGRTVGILSKTGRYYSSAKREQGFREALKGSGVDIKWTLRSSIGDEGLLMEKQPQVDLVAAFDDDSLTEAGKYFASASPGDVRVYGIGHSTEGAYYLDTGVIECLIVPDEFNVGYQSMTEAVHLLSSRYGAATGEMVTYTVIRKETLFTEENQELLFRMSQ